MERYKFIKGNSPLVATAIHNGHEIRPDLLPYLNLTEKQRSREEDPYTLELTKITDNRVEVMSSRFEVDVNRPRKSAVYQKPKDAWGMDLWKEPLSQPLVEKSLQYYDEFYHQLRFYLDDLLANHEYLIVYDIHSYNYRREGIDIFSDPEENPEINVGTGNIDMKVWKGVLNTFMDTLKRYNFEGRHLDIRENVKFQGGYLSKWLYDNYKDRVCAIALEFKKFFMDEWTNEVNETQLTHLKEMLISTVNPVTEAANKKFKVKAEV